ncbi:hypothetical protein PR048_015967 [Dryococelus australis]|uniref:Reverse transcriptase domain-containing protein n=1 Tax=Dryococelus australis TaxID=614101 RepID=A0ABQ9HIT1_9NEOP|nr:hypothetical protein PR048_015967 [Dryococelus australis]
MLSSFIAGIYSFQHVECQRSGGFVDNRDLIDVNGHKLCTWTSELAGEIHYRRTWCRARCPRASPSCCDTAAGYASAFLLLLQAAGLRCSGITTSLLPSLPYVLSRLFAPYTRLGPLTAARGDEACTPPPPQSHPHVALLTGPDKNFSLNISTVDKISSTGQIMEKRWDLWEIMTEFGFPQKFICISKACVTSSRECIKIEVMISNPFDIDTGLRQGDAISPLLFNVVLDSIVRALNTTSRKIKAVVEGQYSEIPVKAWKTPSLGEYGSRPKKDGEALLRIPKCYQRCWTTGSNHKPGICPHLMLQNVWSVRCKMECNIVAKTGKCDGIWCAATSQLRETQAWRFGGGSRWPPLGNYGG